jgi:hypothetical protein
MNRGGYEKLLKQKSQYGMRNSWTIYVGAKRICYGTVKHSGQFLGDFKISEMEQRSATAQAEMDAQVEVKPTSKRDTQSSADG